MQHVEAIVPFLPRAEEFDFHLTPHERRRIESCELVRELRDRQRQDLAFHSRPFVLCGLPIRRPAPSSLKYTRRNGRFVLEIIGHPDFGLPFGQDRLIPLWVATLAGMVEDRFTVLAVMPGEANREWPRAAHCTGPSNFICSRSFRRLTMASFEFAPQAGLRKRIPLAHIDAIVSARLGPTRGLGNSQPAAFNRQVAMYLAKNVGRWTTTIIGRFDNGRDHLLHSEDRKISREQS